MLLERLQQYGLLSIYLLLTNHRILFIIVLSFQPPFQPITVLFTFYGSVVMLLSVFPSSLVDTSLGIRGACCFACCMCLFLLVSWVGLWCVFVFSAYATVSGKSAQMCWLLWAYTGRTWDKYSNLISWLKQTTSKSSNEKFIIHWHFLNKAFIVAQT